MDNCGNNQPMSAHSVVWWLLSSCKLTQLGVFAKCKQLLFAFNFHSRRNLSEISCERLHVFDLSVAADTGRLRPFLLIRQHAIRFPMYHKEVKSTEGKGKSWNKVGKYLRCCASLLLTWFVRICIMYITIRDISLLLSLGTALFFAFVKFSTKVTRDKCDTFV